MPAEIEPPELARLLDAAERPRAERWSFRAALTRYAQPQPERASTVADLLRRTEWALHGDAKLFQREGAAVWAAVTGSATEGTAEVEERVVDLLRALARLDELAEELARWAVDRAEPRPDPLVDEVCTDVAARLDALGVPHEERPRPTGRRGV